MFKLRKSRKILFSATRKFRRYRKRLTPEIDQMLKNAILELRRAIEIGDTEHANACAGNLVALTKEHLKRPPFYYFRDSIISLVVALIVAVIVRQTWFELYEVPTGSMRNTIQERDRLLVSKTTFGLNIPLTRKHLFFNEDAVKRGSIITFTGKGLPIPDTFTYYFYLFPGYKQYVKRCMGKPGDTLYFYGGRMYGVDKFNRDITPELQRPELLHIDHIPFIKIAGRLSPSSSLKNGMYKTAISYQMNEPTCQLTAASTHRVTGKIFPPFIKEYYNLWGFRNYGMVRIITNHEYTLATGKKSKASNYLQITHHANTQNSHLVTDFMGRYLPSLGTYTSYLALGDQHLQEIMNHMYTSRFVVNNEHVTSYGYAFSKYSPELKGVPNGTYEYSQGKAYKIGFGNSMRLLPNDHPLYTYSKERVQFLFNLGMYFDTRFEKFHPSSELRPNRYAFFRNGNLNLMGSPIVKKNDVALELFLHEEYIKQEAAPDYNPYPPFEDSGPPLDEAGNLDVSFIAKYGVKVPDGHYLALGDNYAGSSDSRDFGFVPQGNIKGSPKLMFWPLGSRMGPLNQPSSNLFSLSNFIIWGLALIAYFIWRWYKKHIENCDLD